MLLRHVCCFKHARRAAGCLMVSSMRRHSPVANSADGMRWMYGERRMRVSSGRVSPHMTSRAGDGSEQEATHRGLLLLAHDWSMTGGVTE